MAEITEVRVEALLRETLRAEVATIGMRVTVDDVLARRRSARLAKRAQGWRVLLVAALLTVPAAAFVIIGAQPDAEAQLALGQVMTVQRASHSATRLDDGRVLLVGGSTGWGQEAQDGRSAELYDVDADSFAPTGPMNRARDGATATKLSDGRVLVTGGDAGGSTAELFDPASGTFEPTGDLVAPRTGHAATLLPDGRVVVVGGLHGPDANQPVAEVFDPSSGRFEALGLADPALDLIGPTAVALDDGRVLVVGGRSREGLWKRQAPRTIDPASGDVEQLEPIRTGRYPSFETVDADTAVKLDDGRVLVIAGHPDLDRSSLVIFDPATDEFQPVAEVEGAYRVWPVAPTPGLLPDGRVVIMLGAPRSSIQTLGADEAGGASPSPMPMDPVFVFDPDTAEVTLITTVPGRDRSSLTVLDDGDVLIGGGEVSMGEASAEAWRLSVPDPRA